MMISVDTIIQSWSPPGQSTPHLFEEHPELLIWYQQGCARPLEDIAGIILLQHPSEPIVSIWVTFKEEQETVGYRQFSVDEDGKFHPLP